MSIAPKIRENPIKMRRLGTASYFEKRILTFKTNTLNIAKNSKTLKTLFDKNLNKPNNYSSNMKYPNYPV